MLNGDLYFLLQRGERRIRVYIYDHKETQAAQVNYIDVAELRNSSINQLLVVNFLHIQKYFKNLFCKPF